MYASRVELVGTEKGLGVNLRGTVSATRAVSLDVNGNLRTSGSLYSDGTASVRAEDIENHGLIYGGKDTSVTAAALTNAQTAESTAIPSASRQRPSPTKRMQPLRSALQKK